MFDRFSLLLPLMIAVVFATGSAGAAPPSVPTTRVTSLTVSRPASERPTMSCDLVSIKTMALDRQPSLAVARAGIAEARAAMTEAGLYPNPEFMVEAEEVPNNWDVGGGLVMYKLNQSIITGGKRGLRVAVARTALDRAAIQYEQQALEVVRDVTRAFYETLAASRKIKSISALARLARDFHGTVQLRVEGGAARPIESDRALVLAAQADFDVRKSTTDLMIARQSLATAVGVQVESLGDLNEDHLDHHGTLPPLPELRARARRLAPALRIPLYDELVARKELALARALRIPDITLGVGPQHKREAQGSHDFRGFQISLPIPVFNHGQAERQRAVARIDSALSTQVKASQTLESRLIQAHGNAQRAHEQISLSLDEILPAARRAVDASLEGYQAGKFTYLDVLDAQRALASATQSYIEALLDYRRSHADLEEIVAGEVPEIPEPEDTHEESQ